MRKSIPETWSDLQERGIPMPFDSNGNPFVPIKMPRFDDEELGFQFFKEFAEHLNLDNLSLPKTYVGRSELKLITFINTDLSSSSMCWNDFIACDFSDADLSNSDLRFAIFAGCKFDGAHLSGTDLRGSTFVTCSFGGATMNNATVETDNALRADLSEDQIKAITWAPDAGPEPDGG
ncbi:MAG TPA: pentapeptide repeat-containing protein [Chroococcales cyanobacterium]